MVAKGALRVRETESSDDLVSALSRLNDVLEDLESVVISTEGSSSSLRHLAEDRAVLARRLDECESRVSSLTSVNSEVSRNLVSIMEKVRGIIEED